MNLISMTLSNWFDKIVDFISGFFAFIPMLIFFLYTCCASFLDMLQYLIRKLAGLDSYYVNGQEQTGDIIVSFIRGILGIDKSPAYSALSTVFYSLLIFGVILLVLTTIFAIIKAHYNYDAKKSHPFTIIGQSLKTLALMAIVPIMAVFGLYISQLLLSVLDEITANNSARTDLFGTIEVTKTDENGNVLQDANGLPIIETRSALTEGFKSGEYRGNQVYASYDIFGQHAYMNSISFSGALFEIAGYDCNRVRNTDYNSIPTSSGAFDSWSNFGVFFSNDSDPNVAREYVAQQIDYAFANCLQLKNPGQAKLEKEAGVLVSAYALGYGAASFPGLWHVTQFSKYNVGLVYYYYDLWGYNWFIAFAGVIGFLTLLVNVVFGLITRLVQVLALFIVFPPLIGIAPLDDGNAFKQWRKQFIGDIIMAFGAIVGMNIFFIILPFLNTISFFNVWFLDKIFNLLIMLAGITMVKNLIKLLSSFIGASDANAVGEETKKATAELGAKAFDATIKAVGVGAAIAPGGVRLVRNVGRLARTAAGKIKDKIGDYWAGKLTDGGPHTKGAMKLAKQVQGARDERDQRRKDYEYKFKQDVKTAAMENGMSEEEAEKAANEAYEQHKIDYESKHGAGSFDRHAGSWKQDLKRKHEAKLKQEYDENTPQGQENIRKRNRNRRAFAGVAAVLTGSDIKFDGDGHIDSGATFKAVGKGFLDFGEAVFKFSPGALLRGKAAWKSLEDKGTVIDPFKEVYQQIVSRANPDLEVDNKMKTKKQKELGKVQTQQNIAAATGQIQNYSRQTVSQINQLVEVLRRAGISGGGTPRGGGGTPPSGGGGGGTATGGGGTPTGGGGGGGTPPGSGGHH